MQSSATISQKVGYHGNITIATVAVTKRTSVMCDVMCDM